MMPTVEEICIKDIVTVSINSSIEDAIKKMASSNVRTVLILDGDAKDYYILTTTDAIEYKIQNIPLTKKLNEIPLQRVQKINSKINILEILNQDKKFDEYMVVVEDNKTIGILSQTDIINNIDPQILVQRQTIGKLILQYAAITVYENESTINTIKLMKNKDVDAVIVMDNKTPKGIFTTKDFLNILNKNLSLLAPVSTYMNFPLQTVPSTIKIFDALEYVREKHFKRIIVTNEAGKIEGVITQNELLRIVNNKWMELIREKGDQLSKINQKLMIETASLEEKASKDFLTELYNRRKFDTIIEYEITQLKRYKDREFCLVLLDIDNFKNVNDTYGHDIGDKILQEIASIIKLSLRQSDVASRWGGEEFAVALSETNIEDALLVSEKLRLAIQNHSFTKNLKITCSLGISAYHIDDNYPSFFKKADKALYKAKKTGKNKVAIGSL